MSNIPDETQGQSASPVNNARGRVRYRQSPPAVTYANVFEVRAGAQEVLVTLGYGQTGKVQVPAGEQQAIANELVIDPLHRVALTPQAAQRLAAALSQSVQRMASRQAETATATVDETQREPVASNA